MISSIADVLINLSAAWFGIAFITPKPNMKNKEELSNYLADLNLKASIAFGIALAVFLLLYIAFFITFSK